MSSSPVCSHLDQVARHRAAGAHRRLRGVPEDRRPLAPPAHVRDAAARSAAATRRRTGTRAGTRPRTAIPSSARPSPARTGAGARSTRWPSCSEARTEHAAAGAAADRMGGDEADAAPVGADRRQDAPRVDRAAQPLVERHAVRRRARADDAPDARAERRRLPDPLRLRRSPARGRDERRRGRVVRPRRRALGRRLRRAAARGARPARHRRRHPRAAVRRADDDAVPGRPRARLVRPRRGRALLAHPRLDRRRVRGVLRLVLRQDEPGAPVLALLRPGGHPLRRQARAGDPGCGRR